MGDEIREVRETPVFTPNVYWRLAHNLVNQTDWANPSVKVATAMPSLDVRMQQSFIRGGLELPLCPHENTKTHSLAFYKKRSPQSEILLVSKRKSKPIELSDWTDEDEAALHLTNCFQAEALAREQLFNLLFRREINKPSSCILNAMASSHQNGRENYSNHSAPKAHYKSQSEETEDQSSFQGEEGGDEVMTHQILKFVDLRENEEIPVELPDETPPIDGDELDRKETSQKTETSDHWMDQREQ